MFAVGSCKYFGAFWGTGGKVIKDLFGKDSVCSQPFKILLTCIFSCLNVSSCGLFYQLWKCRQYFTLSNCFKVLTTIPSSFDYVHEDSESPFVDSFLLLPLFVPLTLLKAFHAGVMRAKEESEEEEEERKESGVAIGEGEKAEKKGTSDDRRRSVGTWGEWTTVLCSAGSLSLSPSLFSLSLRQFLRPMAPCFQLAGWGGKAFPSSSVAIPLHVVHYLC